MFVLLEKWLTSQLGNYIGPDLNLSNIGEKFKDGVLFARLLSKLQVMPDRHVHVLKKTHFHAACLTNMKRVRTWLKPLDIVVDDCAVRDIACGKSIAVTKLLYDLYFKFETVNGHRASADDSDVSLNDRPDDDVVDSRTRVLTGRREKREDGDTFDIHKIWCDDSGTAGVRYTAIDFLRSENRRESAVHFTQRNIDDFYDFFPNTLTTNGKKFYENEFADGKSDETCKQILDDIANVDGEVGNVVPNNGGSNPAGVLKPKTSDGRDVSNERKTFPDIDGKPNERSARQDRLLDEYLERTGRWSVERLNGPTTVADVRGEGARLLSRVVKEVLNFEYGKSEIKPIELIRTRVAGVVDKIQSKRMVQMIADALDNKGILGFTADDALSACWNAFKEETDDSTNKSKSYWGADKYENAAKEHENDQTEWDDNSDGIMNEIEEMAEDDSIIGVSYLTEERVSTINIGLAEPENKPELKYVHKRTQTHEDVPEPEPEDFRGTNVELSPMARVGKLIDEKNRENHDLQIGDVINCIGEFLKKHVQNNGSGWVLLEFPSQPLQMTLLEYKLTGNIPSFGREMCKNNTRTSRIVPEHEEDGVGDGPANARVLSRCVKLVQHVDEIKNEKWNDFFDFYKGRISVSKINPNSVRKHVKKAADIIVGMVLNEDSGHKPKNLFKSINVFSDDKGHLDDSMDSDIDNTERSSVTMNEDKNRAINAINHTANQFKLVSADSGLNRDDPTEHALTAFYLRDTWETMENGYVREIKELLDSKDALFRAAKSRDDLTADAIGRMERSNNPRLARTINEYYDNRSRGDADADDAAFRLRCDLWDNVDAEWEQTTRLISDTYDEPRTTVGTLSGVYRRLLAAELKRTIVTLNVLNRYYGGGGGANGTYDIGDLDLAAGTCADGGDAFRTFRAYATSRLESLGCADRGTAAGGAARTAALAEGTRFAGQASRIEASARLDTADLDGLTRADDRSVAARAAYRFKTSDASNVCRLLECAADGGVLRRLRVEQTAGRFRVNGSSVFETVCSRTFRAADNFDARRLRTLARQLLDDCPGYATSVDGLTAALNGGTRGTGRGVYPGNWPTADRFRERFARRVLGGDATTTVDWRDLVVQCAELPGPSAGQLSACRQAFAARDAGDGTVADEAFDATTLWFEDGSDGRAAKKRLLRDMYRTRNGVDYGALLLAFCRDERPWMGLAKSFGLVFGRDPWDATGNAVRSGKGARPDGGPFVFDENVATWFLTTVLRPYARVDVPRIVKSAFARVRAASGPTTVVELFQDRAMDELYGAVYRFQTRTLSKIAMDIVTEHGVCVEL